MPDSNLHTLDTFLSDGARKALMTANEKAREKKSLDIDTEHLLISVYQSTETDAVVRRIFDMLDLPKEEFLADLQKSLQEGKNQEPSHFLPFSVRMKNVLMLSDQIRRRFHHHFIALEHFLLALSHAEGVAQSLLKKFGVTEEHLEEIILSLVGMGKEKDVLVSELTPFLDQFGKDICAEARAGKIDPVIGRTEEIERTIHILARRRKNNPLLVGEPGVGKTAVVEGLAHRIVNGDVPEVLKGKRIISLSLNTLVAGASKRGEFEERLEKLIKEVIASEGDIILFIDEIHTLVGESAGDAAQILKPPLARGEIHCIGATTIAEDHQYLENDAALARRFQKVLLPEPSIEETFEILKGSRDKYEAFHGVKISDEMLHVIVRLASRFLADRFFPDKAFDVLDEAAAIAKMPALSTPEKEKMIGSDLEKLWGELQRTKSTAGLEEITRLQKKISEKEKELSDIHEKAEEEKTRSHDEVTEKEIIRVISQWSGVPLEHLASSESDRLVHLEEILHEQLIGQEYAVSAVAAAVRRGRSGIRAPKRPLGSFLFLGPSGVGKTELAKVLAKIIFGNEESIIRFDMSEFMDRNTVSRLTGPPPGYVGYERGGELTEAVRKRPYSIVLFDEVEKAHPDIFTLFLQILDDGRLTDNHGRTISFLHTIVIGTSNIGSETIREQSEIFRSPGHPQKDEAFPQTDETFQAFLQEKTLPLLLKFFRPELLNRFENMVFFEPLSEDQLLKIADRMIRETGEMLLEKNIHLRVSEAAKRIIAQKGFHPAFGARPLRRSLQTLLEDPLSLELISGKCLPGDTLFVEGGEEKLIFQKDIARGEAKDPFEDTAFFLPPARESNANNASDSSLGVLGADPSSSPELPKNTVLPEKEPVAFAPSPILQTPAAPAKSIPEPKGIFSLFKQPPAEITPREASLHFIDGKIVVEETPPDIPENPNQAIK